MNTAHKLKIVIRKVCLLLFFQIFIVMQHAQHTLRMCWALPTVWAWYVKYYIQRYIYKVFQHYRRFLVRIYSRNGYKLVPNVEMNKNVYSLEFVLNKLVLCERICLINVACISLRNIRFFHTKWDFALECMFTSGNIHKIHKHDCLIFA